MSDHVADILENAALRAENEKLREELRRLQWNRHDPRLSESSCPSCHGIQNLHGHKPNCRIAALLGDTDDPR